MQFRGLLYLIKLYAPWRQARTHKPPCRQGATSYHEAADKRHARRSPLADGKAYAPQKYQHHCRRQQQMRIVELLMAGKDI